MADDARLTQMERAQLGLRQMILAGELAPGERVSELAMVDRLGVSRTPVRLALAALADEGLVEAGASGGFTVASFTEADMYDAIELRGTLEGLAARMAAARRPGRTELAPLRDCVGSLDAVIGRRDQGPETFADYIRLNTQFHAVLVELSGSPMVKRQISRVTALPFAAPNAFVRLQADLPESRHILIVAQDQHRQILEALAGAEAWRAEDIAREHARMARRNLEIALRNRETLSQVPGAVLIRTA